MKMLEFIVAFAIVASELKNVNSQTQEASVFNVSCQDQEEACVCNENYKQCRFQLEIEELQTFTSYLAHSQKLRNNHMRNSW